jgi:HEAT repeat protein
MPDEKIKSLVEQMPKPDSRGILSEVKLEPTLKAISDLHAGGTATVRALADMLVEPGKGNDHQARYALHALALHVCQLAGKNGDDKPREQFATALAETLADDRPKTVKEFIVRELQVCGGPEAAPALGRFILDDVLHEPAAQAMVAIGGERAANEFRQALPNARGRQRTTIVQNLGILRDQQSAKAIAAAAVDDDGEIRAAAAWALANIGDPASIDACLKAAERAEGYERIQAGKSRLLLAERLRDAGMKAEARRVLGHLRETSSDESEAYLRNLAERALATLG